MSVIIEGFNKPKNCHACPFNNSDCYCNLTKGSIDRDDWDCSVTCPIKTLEQEPFINIPCISSGVCEHDKNKILDKIRAEILNCLRALDEVEKSGLNIYLPNEMSGRRLTYQQCLGFVDEYKTEREDV